MAREDLRYLLERCGILGFGIVAVSLIFGEGIDGLDHLQEGSGEVVEVGIEVGGKGVACYDREF